MKYCLFCVLSKLCSLISGGQIKISFNDQHLIQVKHINSRFITEEDKHRWGMRAFALETSKSIWVLVAWV